MNLNFFEVRTDRHTDRQTNRAEKTNTYVSCNDTAYDQRKTD